MRIPQNEVALAAAAEIWQQLHVSDHYASKESIMWNRLSDYVEKGNEYISAIHDNEWFRGWDGRPDGCSLKPVTLAALNACTCTPDDDVKQIFVYLDGSSSTIDSEPVMSWGFYGFEVDVDLKHDLFFAFGGIMCVDKESPLYFGAESCNSLAANCRRMLWSAFGCCKVVSLAISASCFCMTISLQRMQ